MKVGFRQNMTWLHTWTGLVTAWVLFFIFVTGSAGYFDDEITRWMEPERPIPQVVKYDDKGPMVTMALARLTDVATNAEYWNITLPHDSISPRGWQDFSIDPGTAIPVREYVEEISRSPNRK